MESRNQASSPLCITSLGGASKKLFSDKEETIGVYLRLKPVDINAIDDRINANHFEVEGNNCLRTKYKTAQDEVSTRFEFLNIFMPTSTQMEIYDKVVLPKLKPFLLGDDALLFSLGTSNAGKSFTIQGTASFPGIIPRILHSVFQSTVHCLDPEPRLYPCGSDSVEVLCDSDIEYLDVQKQRILLDVSEVVHNFEDSLSSAETSELSSRFSECPFVFGDDDSISLFISFVEVYNEKVFDLLVEASKKKALALGSDNDQNHYVKDLTYLHVNSWEEAFSIYKYGRRNLQVFPTAMNKKSSRSHSVFSIKMVICPKDDHLKYRSVSTFTICDLAGTERVAAKSSGQRVKESNNINGSLFTLHRCFMTLKSNQTKSEKLVPPFRESKLTCLFKKHLLGQSGSINVITNISQSSEIFQETCHILKMSALVYKTKLKKPMLFVPTVPFKLKPIQGSSEKDKPISRFQISAERVIPPMRFRFSMHQSQALAETRLNRKKLVAPKAPQCSKCEDHIGSLAVLKVENEELQKEIQSLKSKLAEQRGQEDNQRSKFEDSVFKYKQKYAREKQSNCLKQQKIDKLNDLLSRIAFELDFSCSNESDHDLVAHAVREKLEQNKYLLGLAEDEICELKSAVNSLMELVASKDGEILELKDQNEALAALLRARSTQSSEDNQENCPPKRTARTNKIKNYAEYYLEDSSSDDFSSLSEKNKKGGARPDLTGDGHEDKMFENSSRFRPLSVRKMRRKKKTVELPQIGRLSLSESNLLNVCRQPPQKEGRRKLLQNVDTQCERTLSGSDEDEKHVPTPIDILKRNRIARKHM